MSKVLAKFQFTKYFSFYLQILKAMQLNKPLPYQYIYSCGGKNSGKTYSICLFIAYLFYYQISASIIIFRKQADSLNPEKGTVREVLDRLEDMQLWDTYKFNKSTKTISSRKTRVIFLSLFNPKGQKIQQLGLTGNSRYTYEIPWFEEIWEMEEQSVRDAQLAVRGAKYTLTLYTTNPYAISLIDLLVIMLNYSPLVELNYLKQVISGSSFLSIITLSSTTLTIG